MRARDVAGARGCRQLLVSSVAGHEQNLLLTFEGGMAV